MTQSTTSLASTNSASEEECSEEGYIDESNQVFHLSDFVFACTICDEIPNNPFFDPSGFCYCEKCFDISTKSPGPIDKLELIFDNSKTIFCENKNRDCKWIGAPNELNAHLSNECLKQFTFCLNKECRLLVTREHLQAHMGQCDYRIEMCDDCRQFSTFIQLLDHNEDCPQEVMACEKNCGVSFLRENKKKHIEDECIFASSNFGGNTRKGGAMTKELRCNMKPVGAFNQISESHKESKHCFTLQLPKRRTFKIFMSNDNNQIVQEEFHNQPIPHSQPQSTQEIQFNNQRARPILNSDSQKEANTVCSLSEHPINQNRFISNKRTRDSDSDYYSDESD